MFRLVVVKGIDKGEATVVISGDAVFTHAQEMQSALNEALDACDRLAIDVGAVDAFDVTFRVLLCSLHRKAELAHKRVSMQGGMPGREGDHARFFKVNGCLFKGGTEQCQLWKTTATGCAPAERGS